MKQDARIVVVGSDTAVGRALVRTLAAQKYTHVMTCDRVENAEDVQAAFGEMRPEYVFVAAGKSGGIELNRTNPVDLMMDNLMVSGNVLPAAHRHRVRKLLYLASSCAYPRDCPQPMQEKSLFAGPVEPTNEGYATAKRAGIKLCQAFNHQYGTCFIPAIPANPFGPGEAVDETHSHVIEALIAKMHHAKCKGASSVEVWGTGLPRREFIFLDDLADACIHVMHHYDDTAPINLGSGISMSIRELAYTIRRVTGFTGALRFDATRPDGMPEKILDNARMLELGWAPPTRFETALEQTYTWYRERWAEAA